MHIVSLTKCMDSCQFVEADFGDITEERTCYTDDCDTSQVKCTKTHRCCS